MLKIGFKITFIIAILGYFILTGKLDYIKLSNSLKSQYVIYSVLLLSLLPFLFSYRWKLLLSDQNIIIPFNKLCQITFIALFFDTLLPAGGADLSRGFFLNKFCPSPENKVAAFGSIFIDRVVGLLSLLMLAVFGFLININYLIKNNIFQSSLKILIVSIFLIIISAIIGFLIFRYRSVIRDRFLTKIITIDSDLILTYFKSYKNRTFDLAMVIILSLFGHLLSYASIIIMVKALGHFDLTISNYLGILPLSFLLSQLPIGPGFVGVGFLSFYALFKSAGSNLGGDIFALYLMVRLLSTLPGSFFYIFFKDGIVPCKTAEDIK